MIVNADDFGYSPKVNEAIKTCFKRGLISRTTVMVNMPSADEAYTIALDNGFLDCVGLHLNLTEGKALSKECAASSLCDENGCFIGKFHHSYKARFFLDKATRRAIYAEAEAQMKKFFDMGFTLKHMDSHNYTHVYLSVYSSIEKLIKKYGFSSVRISRNIPKNSFSFAFKVYKSLFNFIIKRLKVDGKPVKTTKYFGSYQDLEDTGNIDLYKNDIEIMTHPDIIDGVLTDDTLPEPHPFKDQQWLKEKGAKVEDISNKKIKLFISFIQAHIGGAMTSLVNFVNAIDTTRYEVDLMFYTNDGRYGIKDDINILPQGMAHQKFSVVNVISKIFSPSYVVAKIREIYARHIQHNKLKAVQIMSKQGCRYSRKITKEYDIAIAYELSWAMNYVHIRVKAKRKLVWHHMDYENAGFDYKVDKKAFEAFDGLVFVSKETGELFAKHHPKLQNKIYHVPNLLATDYILNKNNEEVQLPFEDATSKLKLLSVSRINYTEKAFDRALRVFKRLYDEGLTENVCWTIIGTGKPLEDFRQRIIDNGLDDLIKAIGLRENPIPYMAKADALLLPSRNEGKPMVITEAFIMGLVPMVTAYTSAYGQIENGVDGLIFENSEEGLYSGLKAVIESPETLETLKNNVKVRNYGNEQDISYFYDVINRIL